MVCCFQIVVCDPLRRIAIRDKLDTEVSHSAFICGCCVSPRFVNSLRWQGLYTAGLGGGTMDLSNGFPATNMQQRCLHVATSSNLHAEMTEMAMAKDRRGPFSAYKFEGIAAMDTPVCMDVDVEDSHEQEESSEFFADLTYTVGNTPISTAQTPHAHNAHIERMMD